MKNWINNIIKIVVFIFVIYILFNQCGRTKEVDVEVVTVDVTDIDIKLDSLTGVLDSINDSINKLTYEKDSILNSIEIDTSSSSIYNKFKELLYKSI